MPCLHEAIVAATGRGDWSRRPVAATIVTTGRLVYSLQATGRGDSRGDRLPVANTRGDCRGDDRRSRTGDRSINPFADRRRYANYIDQK